MIEQNTPIKLLDELFKKIEKHEKETQKKGGYFNIFNILKLTTSEVGLHGILLTELLSPKGKHGQKSLFLELFLKKVGYSNLFNDLIKIKVEPEKPIGEIGENLEKGGRIDIFISNRNTCLIIENKINAGDQEKQLVRYDNYAAKEYRSYEVIYLTLFGTAANKNSITKKDKSLVKYKQISYKTEIKEWLEECASKLENKNSVKEIILQYISVIKGLTHQNENEMDEIIKKTIISKSEYIKTAFEISNSINVLKQEILKTFYKKLNDKLSNYKVETDISSLGVKDSAIKISNGKWKNHTILIYFWDNYSDIIIGIDGDKSSINKLVKSFLFEPLNDLGIGERIDKLNENWIWVNTFPTCPQLKTAKEWSELIEDNTILEVSLEIKKIVKEIDKQISKNIALKDF